MHYIVDLKLIQFQRSEEIVLNCLWVVSKSHLMTAILAKTIQSAPYSEHKSVPITTAHLLDLIEDVLHSSRFIHDDL